MDVGRCLGDGMEGCDWSGRSRCLRRVGWSEVVGLGDESAKSEGAGG